MSCQLPTDCLNEIFEYLEEDKITLHSCLLVSRLWCKISVRILWRNVWRFKYSVAYSHQPRVGKAILSTLIACFPDGSKEILYNLEEGFLQEVITSKPPLFNYAAFCKVLSIYDISQIITNVFKDKNNKQTTIIQPISSISLPVKEIIKMFIDQISSLKKLIHYYSYYTSNSISIINFPEVRDRLIDLSELCCSSNIYSEFFYQLSQICYNLQSLSIDFEVEISNGLNEFISLQNNLKNLNLFDYDEIDWTNIIPALTKHSNTLKKLHIYSVNSSLSLSFIASFLNLQEIKFSLIEGINSEDFKKLQNVTFPKLEILKIPYQSPNPEYIVKFLENNGKYLKELYIDENNDSLGLFIAKFCPNIRKLSVRFNSDKLDTLKTIFNNCQYLESIKVWYGKGCLNETEVLEYVAKYSPENFCELKICLDLLPKFPSEDLELFFIDWKNRASKKLITLIIMNDYGVLNEGDMKIIEKYNNLGIIKKFEVKGLYDEDDDEEEEDRF